MFDLHNRPEPRKRQRDAASSVFEQLPEELPAQKRQKQTKEPETRRHHRSPKFWDRLSKVPLCRASLREFDHRTATLNPHSSGSSVPLSSARVSRPQHLKRFARHGGPDLSYLRGFGSYHPSGRMSQSSASRKRSSASGRSTTSKTRSSTDPAFEQNMIDAGIYPADYDPEDDQAVDDPRNMDDIQAALRVSRPSLSPSRFPDGAFKDFKKMAARARGETSARIDVITIIQGDGRKQHRHGADHVFNHLEPIDKELPRPQPDHYDGALPEIIDRRVRRDLGKYIVPCTDAARPAVPNFVLEAKGNRGHADVLKRQACHHGALGARAIHKLENYQAAEPQYDSHAKCFSSTYHHGTSTLALYGHHTTRPKVSGGQPEYHMTQLRSFSMTDTPKAFREGAGAFRNLRDLSQTRRNSAIDHANRMARQTPARSSSSTLTDSRASPSALEEEPSDTSTDELVREHASEKRSRYNAEPLSRYTGVAPRLAPLTSPHSRYTVNSCASSPRAMVRGHSVVSNAGSRHSPNDSILRRTVQPAQVRRDVEDPKDRRRRRVENMRSSA